METLAHPSSVTVAFVHSIAVLLQLPGLGSRNKIQGQMSLMPPSMSICDFVTRLYAFEAAL